MLQIMFNEAENRCYRILNKRDESLLLLNCLHKEMPFVAETDFLDGFVEISFEQLLKLLKMEEVIYEDLVQEQKQVCHQRYTVISGVLPCYSYKPERTEAIKTAADIYKLSEQTIRLYLYKYLLFQDIAYLANQPKRKKVLTEDDKNFRWALNKYYYHWTKYSLQKTYYMMLKEKYTDSNGKLYQSYPTLNQFTYYYITHKNKQNTIIRRQGVTEYQKNYRPLLGNGTQSFADAVGYGMCDATMADVYLIDGNTGELKGRPVITVCIDAYSSFCMGYQISFEGGVSSLRDLMLNVAADKKEFCRQRGVNIKSEDWDTTKLPGVIISDNGREYTSETFGQITELGLSVINLPPYRPDLKGQVEKFFSLLQDTYKPFLTGNGFISMNTVQRGAPDYRKQACLTPEQFEQIVIYSILFYNNKRTVKNMFFDESFIEKNKPYASDIFKYGQTLPGANLIDIECDTLYKTLLPRTEGNFTRKGLIVSGFRYKNEAFSREFVEGGSVVVAYEPKDCSEVWLFRNGQYIPFVLIEKEYAGKSFTEGEELKKNQKDIINSGVKDSIQAQIDLAGKIEDIVSVAKNRLRGDDKNG